MRGWKQLTALAIVSVIVFGAAATLPQQTISAEEAAELLIQDSAELFAGRNIYFAETNGEPSRFNRGSVGISVLAAVLRQLGANLYSIDWRYPFPTNIDVIVIPNPAVDYSSDQISRLWAYSQRGGRLFMALNPVQDRVGNERGTFAGNNGFLALSNLDYGVATFDNVVVRSEVTENGNVLVWQFATGSYAPDHPITAGVEGEVTFNMARSLSISLPSTGGILTPLIFTQSDYYGETNFQQYLTDGTFNFDIGTDITPGALPLAAAYENPDTGTRMFIVGDRDFITNGYGFTVSPSATLGFVYPANVRVTLQAIAWLIDSETPVFSFPTPAPTATATITPSPLPPTATPTATPGS